MNEEAHLCTRVTDHIALCEHAANKLIKIPVALTSENVVRIDPASNPSGRIVSKYKPHLKTANCVYDPILSFFPPFSLPGVLCDPTELISR